MDADKTCYGCFREKIGSVCPFCGFDLEHYDRPANALEPGTVLAGRYLLGRVLGAGGFGITYLAYDNTLDVVVAVKEYFPSALARRTTTGDMTIVGDSNRDTCANGRERFLAEARVLAKIDNVDGIVHVRDFFEERSTAYFVMEYVEGSTLRQMVEGAGGRLAFSRVRDILLPVMGALTLVHAQGLLHRDISPDNVVMRKNGKPCLIDFGAARFAGSGTPMSVILKPGFAPEEQYSAAGKQGPWSDVYAMAATMYWCVTGTLAQESLERLSDNRLQPPSRLGVDIPAYAENALMAALAVKPENRTQSMSAFIAGLLGQTVEPAASASTPAAAAAGAAMAAGTASGFPETSMPTAGANAAYRQPYTGATDAGEAQAPPSQQGTPGKTVDKLGAWIKTHKLPASLIGVGAAAIIACAIILPITLSGDRSGNTGSTPASDLTESITNASGGSSGGGSTTASSVTSESVGVQVPVPEGFSVTTNEDGYLTISNGEADYLSVMSQAVISVDGRTAIVYDAADFVALAEDADDWTTGTLGTSGLTAGDWSQVTVGGRNGYICEVDASVPMIVAVFDSGMGVGVTAMIAQTDDDPTEEGSGGYSVISAMDSVQFLSQATYLADFKTYTHTTKGCEIVLDEGVFGGTVSMQDGGIGISPLVTDTDTAAIIMPVASSTGVDGATAISLIGQAFSTAYDGVITLDGSPTITTSEIGRDLTFMGHCTGNSGAYYVDFYVTRAGGTTSTMWWSVTVVSAASSYETASNAASYVVGSLMLLSS